MVSGFGLFVLLSGAVIASLGCGSTVSPRYYLLENPALAAAPSTSASALRIAVGSFEVAPPYDQEGVAYRPNGRGAEIGFYQFHRWAMPLEQAIPLALAAALDRQSGVEAKVGSLEAADLEIEGRLLRVEEVDLATEILAEIELEVTWSPGSGGLASSQTVLVVSEPVAEQTVLAVVEALAVALERAASDLASQWQ